MNIQFIPDIPRLHTAITEWAACLTYIILARKRLPIWQTAAVSVLVLPVFVTVHLIGETVPIYLWMPWMMVAIALMYLFIYVCGDLTPWDAGYLWARAFIAAEFAASLEWQLYYYTVIKNRGESVGWSLVCLIVICLAVNLAIGFLERGHIPKNTRIGIYPKEFVSSMLIALSAFLISNVNFAFKNTEFTGSMGAGILSIRTLVDFCGLIMLFAQQEQRREIRLKFELDAMNNILQRQYENYQQTKESVDIIRRQYHDLKHQIAVIRQETDPEKRESYLAEMDHAISVYEAQNKTGSSVLDTVLTDKNLICMKKGINMTCVADGKLLGFIDVMDICSIFGNALDNAIESAETLEDKAKRLIRVAVFSQNDFLMMRFENYCEAPVSLENGLPATTKEDTMLHGFGIRSIKSVAEKYGGGISINTDNNWFTIRVLIPIP
ncbi:MAG: GHKL domain-containing protein [Oscillospiraceae bacterium]|nr:GHKL domain-containing protein [Oscillospiraceae bacterium]